MKKIKWFALPLLLISVHGRAQGFDAEQLLLDIQKLSQLKQIEQDMENGYQALKARYTAIRDIAKGSFSLHKGYLDGLLAVSPAVQGYERIAAIIDMQVSLVQRYQQAWNRFRQDSHLQPKQLAVLSEVYSGILATCPDDLDDLLGIITDGIIRASDAERLDNIESLYRRMQAKLAMIDRINNTTTLFALQQTAEAGDLSILRQWYGLTP